MKYPARTRQPTVRRAGPGQGLRPIAAAAVCLVIAGCGGGGGDAAPTANDATQALATIEVPEQLPATSAACTGNLRNDVLAHVNAYRAAGATCASGTTYPAGGTALAWHDALEAAALAHSQAMIDTDQFAHVVTGEDSLGLRIEQAGYLYSAARENIAAGIPYGDVGTVVAAWMNSKTGHCDNIMAPAMQHVAVACLPGKDSNYYRNYWTMDLGRL